MSVIIWATDKLLTLWDLYYSTSTIDYATLTKLTSTNEATVLAELAALTYATVWHISGFSVSHTMTNEETIRAGNCGVGELWTLAQTTPTMSFTWLDVNNRAVFSRMLWSELLTVADPEQTIDGYEIDKKMIPFGVYKFVSCVNPISPTEGKQDTIYCVKFRLSWDLVEQYVDLSADGSTFAWVECTFTGANWGRFLKSSLTVDL